MWRGWLQRPASHLAWAERRTRAIKRLDIVPYLDPLWHRGWLVWGHVEPDGRSVPVGCGPVREPAVHHAPAKSVVQRDGGAPVVDDIKHKLQFLINGIAVRDAHQSRSQAVPSCRWCNKEARHGGQPLHRNTGGRFEDRITDSDDHADVACDGLGLIGDPRRR